MRRNINKSRAYVLHVSERGQVCHFDIDIAILYKFKSVNFFSFQYFSFHAILTTVINFKVIHIETSKNSISTLYCYFTSKWIEHSISIITNS